MKSKYLEGECRRLGRLLQCCCAENQALRFTLQMGNNAFAASATKQESAVLLLGMTTINHFAYALFFLFLFRLVSYYMHCWLHVEYGFCLSKANKP